MCGVKLIMVNIVFIHSSIKTRIETKNNRRQIRKDTRFLYIVPLKQGLKHN